MCLFLCALPLQMGDQQCVSGFTVFFQFADRQRLAITLQNNLQRQRVEGFSLDGNITQPRLNAFIHLLSRLATECQQ